MRTNKVIAGMVLGVAFPALYYTWVMTVKNTWVQSIQTQIDNDIIDSHPDVLNPDKGRFGRRSPER